MKILICDDDKEIIDKCKGILRSFSKRVSTSIQIIEYGKGDILLEDEEEWIDSVSVMYLDIELGDINGIELAKKIRDRGYNGDIIFLTVSKDYVFDSFEVKPLNYVLKNDMESEKFFNLFREVYVNSEKTNDKNLILKQGKNQVVMKLNDINYFEANRKKIIVSYSNSKSKEFYSTMGEIEGKLPTNKFIRIHKSYIISLEKLTTFDNKEVILNGDIKLPFGRKYKGQFKEKFFQFINKGALEIS
ncbi:LytR/AlgR family response regulator transcription factor [Clostridium chrysemydis]|uniref:LytR/AlgR family response regulator transcription factor n=1 Tax=Clostridium chrysemydis TaxID=2665504 RepID=UPI001883984B|nr:LytTR family DNA-binding domain-containing protein [Clostridium chrysemydis]